MAAEHGDEEGSPGNSPAKRPTPNKRGRKAVDADSDADVEDEKPAKKMRATKEKEEAVGYDDGGSVDVQS